MMDVNTKNQELSYSLLTPDPWPACSEWITRWADAPVDLMLLDVPQSSISVVADVLSEVAALEGFSETPTTPGLHSSNTSREALLRLLRRELSDIVFNMAVGDQNLAVSVFEPDPECYVMEMVLWPDMLFPADKSAAEHRKTFEQIIQFALDLCSRLQARKIVLSEDWDGAPLEVDTPKNKGRKIVIWQAPANA